MEENIITLKLEGEDTKIDLSSFLKASEKSFRILTHLEGELYDKSKLEWMIVDLQLGSAVVEIEPQTTEYDDEMIQTVIKEYVEGLETLEGEPVLPSHFSKKMLTGVKELVDVLNDGINSITVSNPSRKVSLTQRSAANAEEVLGGEFQSKGSIEGKLEMVSTHSGYFNLYETFTGGRVRCNFDPSDEDIIEEIRGALNERVLIYGNITSDMEGSPQEVETDYIRVLDKSDDLPQVEDIKGIDPDFTGGLPAEDYIDRLHEGE